MKNFLPEQYKLTNKLSINHNYLTKQFEDHEEIFKKISKTVIAGDFTLGEAVNQFEDKFADVVKVKHCIGVGSGTDAIFLSLKAFDVGEGDEVITTAFTFYATIGAIATTGAKPVFVDVKDDYNINEDLIEKAITKKTKAIVPVHWSGKPYNMDKIIKVAKKYNLKVVEDACHGIKSTYKSQTVGSFGDFGCFSMHPLKNLNIWGDGGVVCTNSDDLANKMRLMRNHGLVDRDNCEIFGYNSRLDTIQAIVGQHLIKKIDYITSKRIENANFLDSKLENIPQVKIHSRDKNIIKEVFHIYSLCYEDRDNLQKFLIKNDIDAKIHYPIPMHLQKASAKYGYNVGDFPNAEKIARSTLSLPVHEFINKDQLNYMSKKIKEFYN